MKVTENKYEEWCGKFHLENSCIDVHDSAEAIDFAEFLNQELLDKIKEIEAENKRLHNEYSKAVSDYETEGMKAGRLEDKVKELEKENKELEEALEAKYEGRDFQTLLKVNHKDEQYKLLNI
jgi:chromosome segregation ATPase